MSAGMSKLPGVIVVGKTLWENKYKTAALTGNVTQQIGIEALKLIFFIHSEAVSHYKNMISWKMTFSYISRHYLTRTSIWHIYLLEKNVQICNNFVMK